jgi:hypothetical protein
MRHPLPTTVSCVECLVPSWWHCLGRLWKLGGEAYLEEIGPWGPPLKFILGPQSPLTLLPRCHDVSCSSQPWPPYHDRWTPLKPWGTRNPILLYLVSVEYLVTEIIKQLIHIHKSVHTFCLACLPQHVFKNHCIIAWIGHPSFSLMTVSHVWIKHHLLTHSSTPGRLGYFQFGAIINEATVNICIQTTFGKMCLNFSWEKHLGVGMLVYMVSMH